MRRGPNCNYSTSAAPVVRWRTRASSSKWLDENRLLLDPLGGIDPSILRLEGLVGHFSTYSFVAVTAVPEPSSLLLVAVAAIFARRTHRRFRAASRSSAA